MTNTPISDAVLKEQCQKLEISNVGKATIREIVGLVNSLEKASGEKFVRMEMGSPSLMPPQIGTEAEIKSLQKGVAAVYPMVDGVPELKYESSRFIKNFIGVDVSPESCVPTVGSMQGGYATFLTCSNLDPQKDTALFIDPGFPVQKQQFNVMGHKFESFDVYDYRGEKLREKLESYLSKGNINSIIYSNPNNPTWICFTEEELKIIGDLANKYDVIVIEDLAYFRMDFRDDTYHPGFPPYQASVANYTDNYVLMISGSKAFSYAGQRVAVVAISDKIFHRSYPNLQKRFGRDEFGATFVMRIIYALSSGVCHSAQFGFAAMLKAANDGTFNFIKDIEEYGKRAAKMKKLFVDAGFTIVYDKDIDKDLADGFYFTITYKDWTGAQLLEELLRYGISAITLDNTGSKKYGLRACVSLITPDKMELLEKRLALYKQNH